MEIVGVLETIQKYIPNQYIGISQIITFLMPYIFLVCSVITIFLGYKFHRFWARLTMTFVAFLIGAFISVFFPNVDVRVFIAIGIILAGITAYFSKYLYKVQIFLVNVIPAYITIPTILEHFIPGQASVLIGGILSIIIGIVALKYKYIVTIINSAILGSMLAFRQIFYILGSDSKEHLVIFYLLVIIFSIIGSLVQFKYCGKDEINKVINKFKKKKSSEDLIEK